MKSFQGRFKQVKVKHSNEMGNMLRVLDQATFTAKLLASMVKLSNICTKCKIYEVNVIQNVFLTKCIVLHFSV